VELLPGFQDDCWFSTGHFADVMMGFGHDAEASTNLALIVCECNPFERKMYKLNVRVVLCF
jgi:hypothetical protein